MLIGESARVILMKWAAKASPEAKARAVEILETAQGFGTVDKNGVIVMDGWVSPRQMRELVRTASSKHEYRYRRIDPQVKGKRRHAPVHAKRPHIAVRGV